MSWRTEDIPMAMSGRVGVTSVSTVGVGIGVDLTNVVGMVVVVVETWKGSHDLFTKNSFYVTKAFVAAMIESLRIFLWFTPQ